MYSKQEATQLKKEFWTAFGQYMTPVLSSDGEKVSWVNYKTGEKDIAFRMQADNKKATLAVELAHADTGMQQLYFEQFLQLKTLFKQTVGEWRWQLHTINEFGKTVSKIETELIDVSIFKREDWPALISFFKKNMTALDEFWSGAKYTFEALR